MRTKIQNFILLFLVVLFAFGFTACQSSPNSGNDGVVPHIGDNGNWFIGDKDTGVSAQGLPNNVNGNDGIVPHVGANGNWFIGSTDTGIPAQGASGGLGNNGVVPHIGDNGNWHIGNEDTLIPAQGTSGSTSSDDGIVPHIGDNGNWFIGEEDTGISAKGTTGDSGSNGLTAYEIYIKYYPEYTGDEEQWYYDLATGRLANYVVIFDSHGGSSVTAIANLKYGSKVIEPEVPVRVGYHFLGWYRERGYVREWDFDEDGVTTNTTLYAKWEEARKQGDFSPNLQPGMYNSNQTLTFDLTDGDVLFYTIDGSQPQKLALVGGNFVETASTKVYTSTGILIRDRRTEPGRLSDEVDTSRRRKDGITQRCFEPVGSSTYGTGNPDPYNRGMVIKAAALKPDGTMSEVWTGSYFVWPNHQTEFNLPIMSLSLPFEDLFSPEAGIYRNYLDDTLSAMCDIEFFDKDKKLIFVRDGSIKIGGNWHVRSPKKTFNVNMNRGRNNTPVTYPMWGINRRDGTPLDRFLRFRLRGGGNDSYQGGFSDPLTQRFFKPLENTDTSAYVPTALYLNGDFWGVYEIREHHTDRYFEDHYGINRNDVLHLGFLSSIPEIREAPFTDIQDPRMNRFWDMYEFARINTVFTDALYAEFEEKYMNVDSLIDTYLAYIFSGNPDYPGNNNRIWCALTPSNRHPKMDGRWNLMLHDFDHGFGGGLEGDVSINRNLIRHMFSIQTAAPWGTGANPAWSTLYFRRLMTNENFRSRFLNRMVYFGNVILDVDRFDALVDEMAAELAPMRTVNQLRWKMNRDLSWWTTTHKNNIRAYKRKIFDWTAELLRSTHTMGNSALINGPQKNAQGVYVNAANVFLSDRTRTMPLHYNFLAAVEVWLTTANQDNANTTTLKWGFSSPATSSTAPSSYQESITVWPDNKLTKELIFFNNMYVVLDNQSPNFLRYEISDNDGGTFTNVTDRNHTFRTSNSTELRKIIRTVYSP